MAPGVIKLCVLVLAIWQVAVTALPNAQNLGATISEPAATASKTIDIGTPPISTFAVSGCNVEGSLAPTPSAQAYYTNLTDQVKCQLSCQTDTPCRFYSWDTSATATQRCGKYYAQGFDFTVVPGNTSVFFSKRKDCYAITNMNSTSSRKFPAGGRDMWVNTGIHDCGVEGSASYTGLNGEDYQFDTVLECQTECAGVNGCFSYAWNTNAPDGANNCHLHSGWISEYLSPSNTGIYFSDSSAKMNNVCFRDRAFGSPQKVIRDTPTSIIIGLPEISSTTSAECNIQGTLPASSTAYHTNETDYDILQCM